jgi:peptidoglycan/xylan/chitin deacetylase (PgdA/CDA1 family)
MKYTAFVAKNLVGGTGYMTLAQLKELYATGYADISNHTVTHTNLSTLTYAQQYTEINDMRNYLIENGFDRAKNVLCYPEGGYDANTLAACSAVGINVARTTNPYQQPQPVQDALTFKTLGFSSASTLATTIPYVERAIDNGDCMSLNMHKIVAAGAAGSEVNTATLTAILDYCVSRKVTVLTFAEWQKSITNIRKA